MFIDHRFFEMVEGVTLTVNPARATGERVLVMDAPWERDAKLGSYCTVVDEGGKVRMWYHVLAGVPEPGKNPPLMGVGYAESTDGVHFTKPRLGLVEWNGSKDNNVVMPHDLKLLTVGGGSVWRDENPACPPERRYKSWCKVYPKPGSGLRGPHRVWYSADGSGRRRGSGRGWRATTNRTI